MYLSVGIDVLGFRAIAEWLDILCVVSYSIQMHHIQHEVIRWRLCVLHQDLQLIYVHKIWRMGMVQFNLHDFSEMSRTKVVKLPRLYLLESSFYNIPGGKSYFFPPCESRPSLCLLPGTVPFSQLHFQVVSCYLFPLLLTLALIPHLQRIKCPFVKIFSHYNSIFSFPYHEERTFELGFWYTLIWNFNFYVKH